MASTVATPVADVRPDEDRATAPPRPVVRSRHLAPWTGRGLVVLLVLVVVTQRFLVPPGLPVALALLLVYAGVAVLWSRGRLRVDRVRVELFAAAAVLILLATAGASATGGSVSITSVGLLLVLWAPWVLRLAPGHRAVQEGLGDAFVNLMVVLALVGVAQMGLQLAGLWTFEDYLDVWLRSYLQQGFNASDPIFYGSSVWKSNGFVFLEASTFSQYCGLAVIFCLVMRQPAWKLLVLALGMASTVSGTGIVLVIFGAVLVVLRAPRLLRPSALLAGAAAVGIVFLSPVYPLLLGRVDEPTRAGSSGSLRFVQPYTEVMAGLDADPLRYLFGAGPGAVQRLLESGKGGTLGQAVLYPIVPKAVFEYGVIAGGVFVLFIALAVLDRGPWPVVPAAVLFWLVFLGGNLLLPQTVALAWLLTSVLTDQQGPVLGRRATRAPRRSSRARRGRPRAHALGPTRSA